MTPQERLKIWRQEQEAKTAKTAEDRRRIWRQERQQQAPPAPTPPQEDSLLDSLILGAKQGATRTVKSAVSLADIAGKAATGDFRPLMDAGELAIRGAMSTAGYLAAGAPTDPKIAEAKAQQEAYRATAIPNYPAITAAEREFAEQAARSPSLRNKIARGAGSLGVEAIPYIATGAAGGGIGAMTGVAGAMSAGEPETAALNMAAGVALPAMASGVAKAIAPVLKRIKGRNIPAPGEIPPVTGTASQIRRTGAVADLPEQAAIRAESGGARLESPRALPPRPNLDDGGPPLLEVADDAPFGVSLGRERPPTPGRVGPRFDEAVELALRGGAPIARAAERSPWQDTTLAYFRANLLTNPGGRATDLGSTIINQFADAATRPVAAATDIIVSKLTGVRSITGISPRGTGRALGSIRQGLRDAKEVLKTGKQAIDSGADDPLYSAEIRSGLGKPVDLPINGVFRVLGALDAPFRRYGFARNLYDRARVAASNEARRGAIPRDQLLARTRQLLDDPGIISAAVRDGEASVLSEANKFSSGLAKLTANSPNARLAIGLVQPFMRIPLNAVLKAADFSGIGGVKALYKVARGVGRKARGKSFFRDLEEQRVFSQNVAAGSFGPAAFLLGMELEDQGKLEGYYYTSKKDYPNGKTPTSINIQGQNYDINRLGGFIAAPLFIGATYNRLRKQDPSKAMDLLGKLNLLSRSFSGLIQTAPALGYYGVPAKAGRLLTSDEPVGELEKEAGGIVSGFIPASGALGAAAKALDPEAKREAEGFTGPIMNRIPGLRQQLPVKKNKKNAARK